MRYFNRMKKAAVFSLLFFCFFSVAAQAFLFEIVFSDKAVVAQWKDEKLIDMYIDAMIELEAANKFFSNTGMKPKEYKKYKRLLRYRTDLLIEIQARELMIPKMQ